MSSENNNFLRVHIPLESISGIKQLARQLYVLFTTLCTFHNFMNVLQLYIRFTTSTHLQVL